MMSLLCNHYQESDKHSIELLEDPNHLSMQELASHLGLQVVCSIYIYIYTCVLDLVVLLGWVDIY